MAQLTVETTDNLNQGRIKINTNFTEVYQAAADAQSDADTAQTTASAAGGAATAAQGDIDTHEARTDNPHSVTKAQIGLGNVDNTSDLNKPISSATQSAIEVVTTVSVSGALVLDDTAFGKIHELSGTSADYTVTIPAPSVGNNGKTIYFKGLSTLTKIITLSNGVITIDGEANIKITKGGIIGIKSNGINYIIIAEVGSWIAWTPTAGANQFSVLPTLDAAYFKVGRKIDLRCLTLANGTSGGASQTTFTFTNLPFAPKVTGEYPTLATNTTLSGARASLTAASTTVTFFSNVTGSGFTAAAAKGIHFTWTYEY